VVDFEAFRAEREQTMDEVRDAVRDFVARDNADWLIEKNGSLSPLDVRAARLDTNLRCPAWCSRVSGEAGPVQSLGYVNLIGFVLIGAGSILAAPLVPISPSPCRRSCRSVCSPSAWCSPARGCSSCRCYGGCPSGAELVGCGCEAANHQPGAPDGRS
jgi:hypothetical protein